MCQKDKTAGTLPLLTVEPGPVVDLDRIGRLGFILGIWVFRLVVSPVWLRYSRFGLLKLL